MPASGSTRRKILFIAEAVTLAHAVRPLVLARSLDSARYEIHFACVDRYRRFFREGEFNYWPIDTIPEKEFLNAIEKGVPPYSEKILSNYVVDDLKLIKKINPHIIVGDHRRSLAISAPISKTFYAALTNAHWSPYSALQRLPMPEHPLVKLLGVSAASRLADWFVRPITFKLYARPVNRLRRKHGLPSLGDLRHTLTTPGDFTLFADTPGLSATIDLPPNHRYIGPLLWSPETPLPEWWEQLPDDRPLVYVTLGSSGKVDLLPDVVAALAGLPVTAVVATAGRLSLEAPPDNVWCTEYLPGAEASRQSGCVIGNGGSGTVHQGLAAGVPVLGIASNMDQYMVMSCVTKAGAGILLRAGKTTRAKVATAVMDLLENADYRHQAQKLAREFAQLDPACEFPAFIEAFFAGQLRN